MATSEQYTYRAVWSQEDDEYVGLCAEFPSLSWMSATEDKALSGIRNVVEDVVADMQCDRLRCDPGLH